MLSVGENEACSFSTIWKKCRLSFPRLGKADFPRPAVLLARIGTGKRQEQNQAP